MKININGINYIIKEITQKDYKKYRQSEDENLECEITDTKKGVWFGASHNYPNIIFIDKNLTQDRKRKVLIHELTHCYISEYIAHEEKQFNEEDVADISANSHDIIHSIVEKYFK